MENSNNNFNSFSDKALLKLSGVYLKEIRLRLNKTQEEIALTAGINRSTLVQFEKGEGGGMITFVQILRAIDQFHVFKNFELIEQISPLLLAKIQRNKKQRATKKNNSSQSKPY